MDVTKAILENKNGYCLRLANGHSWNVIATNRLRSWVEKLACTLELRACELNGYPKLIFVHKQKADKKNGAPVCLLHPKIRESLPPDGWESQDIFWFLVWSHHEVQDVICEMGLQVGNEQDIQMMRMALHPIYQRSQDTGGLPLHAALLEQNGFGILLAAQGGTGKSTCCRRLGGPWRALCDDEALIVRDHKKGYLVHPFPTWSDYLLKRSDRTWNVQRYLPISAIFFLEQSGADTVVPIGQGQAAVLLYQSAMQVCSRNWMNLHREGLSMLRKQLFENVCDLVQKIPTFKLRVSLEGEFWEEMEKVL